VATARRLMRISTEPVWATMQARSWDTDVWVGSPASMAQNTTWHVRLDFEAGLKRTIEWFHHHPLWLQFYAFQILG
jgi:hypothetical protein